jgi:pentapeptide MXKDX repeat protein
MTTFKTLAITAAISLFAGNAAMAMDAMKSDSMMKSDAALMKTCKALGDKAKTNPKCVAMMKKTDAMKSDAMKSDHMKSDAMKSDHMKGDAMKSDAMKGDSMASDHH